MGLMLSIAVIFVSAIELLAVYSKFRTNLEIPRPPRDLSPLVKRYEEGLHKERDRILKILQAYRIHQDVDERFEPKIPKTQLNCPSTPLTKSPIKTNGNANGRLPSSVPPPSQNSVSPKTPSEKDTSAPNCDKPSSSKRDDQSIEKTPKSSLRFSSSLEELEPDWSRAPSPLCKVPNAQTKSNQASLHQTLQITDLNQQIVTDDYWRRSPSPFKEILSEEDKKIVASDDDQELPFHELSSSKTALSNSEAWDPERDVVQSDEDFVLALDADQLDGLKPSKAIERRRSFRSKKKSKQKSLEIDPLQNSVDLSSSIDLQQNVEGNAILVADKSEFPELDADESASCNERNAASNAFWVMK